MFGNKFILNEDSLAVIEQFGEHMPGGFFIHSRHFPISDGFEMAAETTEPDFLRLEQRDAA